MTEPANHVKILADLVPTPANVPLVTLVSTSSIVNVLNHVQLVCMEILLITLADTAMNLA